MFQENKENQAIQSFSDLPSAIIKIPVSQPIAALLLHLCNHRIGAVSINIEELKSDGAQLVISSIVNKEVNTDTFSSTFGVYRNDDLKSLKELINDMVEEKFNENDEELLEHFNKLNEEDNEDDWEKYLWDDEEELAF